MDPIILLRSPFMIPVLAFATALWVILLSSFFDRPHPGGPAPYPSRLTIFLANSIRMIIHVLAALWAIWLYFSIISAPPTALVTLSTLMRSYGLTALFLLFAALIPGLVRVYFPHARLLNVMLVARRAIGVSAFFFALLHAARGFLGNYAGSIEPIRTLSARHQLAILFGALALLIFFLLAATSFDRMVTWLTFPRWKWLHRLIYPAIILVLFHAFLIGSHFSDRSLFYPLLVNYLALTFLLLEIGATLTKLRATQDRRSVWATRLAIVSLTILGAAGVFTSLAVLPSPITVP